MSDRLYAVYILASQKRGTLYIGMTNNLRRRILEHHEGKGSKFAARYNLQRLVFCEFFQNVSDAISREKQLKNWRRAWKISLIEEQNADWNDLAATLR